MMLIGCLSTLFIIISNGWLYTIILVMLLNLSIYTVINDINYRNIFNYILISTLAYIILIIGILNSLIILFATVLAIKLVLYPFTIWAIPIYHNIKLRLFIFITIVSKLVYIAIMGNLLWKQELLYVLVITAMLISADQIQKSSTSLISIMVYSSAVQLSIILLPLLYNNFDNFVIYFLYYLLTLTIIYLVNSSNSNYYITYFILTNVFINYIGLPPFIGFIMKASSLQALTANYLMTLFIYLLSTLALLYMYMQYINLNLNAIIYLNNLYEKIARKAYICNYILLYLSIFGEDIYMLL